MKSNRNFLQSTVSAAVLALLAGSAQAAVSEAEAAKLGKELTFVEAVWKGSSQKTENNRTLSRLQCSQRPELARADLGAAAPEVIAGQVDVFPA
jgi:ABC-type proline/glycine betaine transport system substrate-binding protein